jgi:TfoX/Sxy family transcriptional regulator of competence genes
MAYDRELAERVRECLALEAGVSERSMFGGLAFLIDGKMSVSVSGQGGLLLRVDPAQTDKLVARAHVQRFVMRGREMGGWLRIDPDGLRTKRELARWVAIGVGYARSLSASPRARDSSGPSPR